MPLPIQHVVALSGSGAQRIGGFDAYDLVSALLAICSAVVLLVIRRSRPAGAGSGRSRRIDELLLCLAAVGVSVFLLHQVITDGVCHGSCALSL